MVVGVRVTTNAAEVKRGIEGMAQNLTYEVYRASEDLARKSLAFFRDNETRGTYVEHYRRRTGYGLQKRSGATDDQLRRSYDAKWVQSTQKGSIFFSLGERVLRHDEEYTISRAGGWIVFPGDDAVDANGVLLPEYNDAAVARLRDAGLTFWMPTKSPTLAFIAVRPFMGERALRVRVASKKVTHPKRVSPEQHFTFSGGLNKFFDELVSSDRTFDEAFKKTLAQNWPQGKS